MQYFGIASLLIVLVTATRWFQLAIRVNIPRKATQFQLLWGTGLILGGIALFLDSTSTVALWGVGLAVLLLYLSSTGAQRVDGDSLDVGDSMPAFSAIDAEGVPFDSTSLEGSPVLLKFFRGHW